MSQVPANVVVTPSQPTLSPGGSQQFQASILDSKGVAILGLALTWLSVAPSTVSVDQTGLATAQAAGSATVTATVTGTSISGSATVSVQSAQTGDFNAALSPHAPWARFEYTDFRIHYIPGGDPYPTSGQALTEQQFMAGHLDGIMNAIEYPGYATVGVPTFPYTLICHINADGSNSLFTSSDPDFTAYCTAHGIDPELGYLHYKAGVTMLNGQVSTGAGTKAERFQYNIPNFPPVRWGLNPNATRTAYEQDRVGRILLAAAPNTGWVKGIFVDSISPDKLDITANANSIEYPSGTAAQYYSDLATMFGAIYASMPSTQNILQLNTAAYSDPKVNALAIAAHACHKEQFNSPRRAFWSSTAGNNRPTLRILTGAGCRTTLVNSFGWDDVPSGGGGLWANDPLPLGCASTSTLREKVGEYWQYLDAWDSAHPDMLYFACWNSQWDVGNANAGLNNRWLKLFEYNIGTPVTDTTTVLSGVSDPLGQAVQIRRRDFTKATLFYRPVSQNGTVQFGPTAVYNYPLPTSSAPSGLWQRIKSDATLDTPTGVMGVAPADGALWVADTTGSSGVIGAEFFVSPTGSASNPGTQAAPWSWAFMLAGAGGALTSPAGGATVWVRGADYSTSDAWAVGAALTGSNPDGPLSPNGKVHIRAFPGEAVTISNRLTLNLDSDGAGTDTWWWDLYIKNTDVNSADAMGVDNHAPRARFIRCVSQDHSGNGFGLWAEGPDNGAVACVSYGNGFTGTTPGVSYGHGYYFQNTTGNKEMEQNVAINNFGYGFHHFASSGGLVGVHMSHNMAYCNGKFTGTAFDATFGGQTPLVGFTSTDDWFLLPVGSLLTNDDTAVRFGFGVPGDAPINHDAVITKLRSTGKLLMCGWDSGDAGMASFEYTDCDIACGSGPGIQADFTADTPSFSKWNGHGNRFTIPAGQEFNPFLLEGASSSDNIDFATWKSDSGQDADSTTSAGTNLADAHSLRVSSVDPKFAVLRIHNPSGASTVAFNPATDDQGLAFLAPGDFYEVYSYLAPRATGAAAVLSGTYAGGSLSVAMVGQAVPPLLGGPLRGVSPIDPQPYVGTFQVFKG